MPRSNRHFLPATCASLALAIAAWSAHAADQKTPEEIFAEHAPAVVMVQAFDWRGRAVQFGSGFLIDPSGIFVTNYHVVERGRAVTVALRDGREFDVTGVVAISLEADVAILKFDAQGLKVATLGDSDVVKTGQRVLVIGNPMGLGHSLSDGLVSAIRGDTPGERVFQITAPISPGSSGGPVLNLKGEVIGIAFAQLEQGQNLNFAISINVVKPLIETGKLEALGPDSLVPTAKTCPVVGNQRSWIYHVPGGQYYDQMLLSPDGVCFASEEEAVAGGYRRSLH